MKRLFLLLILLSVLAMPTAAEEIGFIEDFALAENRAAALEQLIPGTEAYYYFHALHFQNTRQFDKVESLLPDWIKKHGETGLVREIKHRQALLTYDTSPEKSLAYLKQTLGLQFNHQRELLDKELKLPSALDQKQISRETLLASRFRNTSSLNEFENSALFWLASEKLTDNQRRLLLQRVSSPDLPNLVALIQADLKAPNSGGFGSLEIHRRLTLAQLNALAKANGELKKQSNFVQTYVAKLAPNPDVLWQRDLNAQREYLNRVWSFADTLPPTFNGLKSQTLYSLLVLNLREGKYDKALFIDYLKLPKYASYVEPKYLEQNELRRYATSLSDSFGDAKVLPPIQNDEPVVRTYLEYFFVEAADWKEFQPYIHDIYLKELFAEVKILHGLGDEEKWSALLPPEKFQALKERVDISFPETNPEFFAPGDDVKLSVVLKNTPTLLVKVYEINAETYYRQNLSEVDTDIELDGLTANHEETVEIHLPPLRQTTREFAFPQIKEPGVYVVDFLANGRSSRALVRIGELRFTVDSTASGHAFRVYNAAGKLLTDARIWLAGHKYSADKAGVIRTPYSTNRGRQAFVMSHGALSSLGVFQHASEDYRFHVGFYVDRENLIARQRATLLIRSGLFVDNTPIGLSILEDVELTISSTTIDNVQSTQVVKNLELFEDAETKHEFRVPPRLRNLQFVLKAKVKNVSTGKTVELSASDAISINGIDATERTQDLHLAKFGDSYVVELLGKSGEVLPKRAVHVSLKHRDFTSRVNATLQTDASGRIILGELADITSVSATSPQGVTQQWGLLEDGHSQRSVQHAVVGETIEVPWMGATDKITPADVSLFEVREGVVTRDYFASISVKGRLLQIADLPRGDYVLTLKQAGVSTTLRVAQGKKAGQYVLGESRILELRDTTPLQISNTAVQKDGVLIQLANHTKFTRVHVFAARYEPVYSPFEKIAAVRDAEALWRKPAIQRSAYVAGRNIGEEYQYILSRRLQKKFPGLMLSRPEFLLNPWAIRTTETQKQIAQIGDDFGGEGTGSGYGGMRPPPAPKKSPAAASQPGFASLDFLAQTSASLVNLKVDKNGQLVIPTALLSGRQRIHIVAVDPDSTVYRAISLPEVSADFVDLRLANSLDPKAHYIQQNNVTIVPKGESIVFRDAATSQFETYDSLDDVYRLYLANTQNSHLAEFGFLMKWPTLTDEEQRATYSKYACHELNFFLHEKDPKFYNEVVKPYLQNKFHKTFLDHWQLRTDLASYRQPWKHSRLNTVEQILLGQRIGAERPFMQRSIQDQYALLPPRSAQWQQLFESAVVSTSLDAEDRYSTDDLHNAIRDKAAGEWSELQRKQGGLGPRAGDGSEAPADPGFYDNSKGNSSSKSEGDAKGDAEGESKPSDGKPGEEANKRQAEKKLKELGKVGGKNLYYEDEKARRNDLRRYYTQLDATKEWVENNYYKLPIEQQLAELVTVNRFWRDYALHNAEQPFLTTHLPDAGGNFTEMMFALSVLDLPFEADEPKSEYQGPQLTIQSPGPMVVFHQEIEPADKIAAESPILVRQRFFKHGDRHKTENGQQVDKFVSDEFVIHQVYGCQVVVTNPTSAVQKLDLLLQIPQGAMPVLNAKPTTSTHIDLQPFHTQTVEYHFYFPVAGEYTHYPVNVSRDGEVLAFVESQNFTVVNKPTQIDASSWAYISQHGSTDEVLKYLEENNLLRLDLAKIAFRMKDEAFFQQTTALLNNRHAFNDTLWSYSIMHNDQAAANEYLRHSEHFVAATGMQLESPLLTIDPVLRHTYQHREYRPLVNARAHQLGKRRQILNDRLHWQYHEFLKLASYKPELSHEEIAAATYYLLLQDRIEEAIAFYNKIEPKQLATKLQYDYLTAYISFYLEDLGAAEAIARKYENHPVDRWREAFASISATIREINGAEAELVKQEDRDQKNTQLADTAPAFDFAIEGQSMKVNYQNIDHVEVRYYQMDIELLFSRNPFVKRFDRQAAYIRPNVIETVKLAKDQAGKTIPLPKSLVSQNVLVEMVAGGETHTEPYFSNSLNVQLIENYGQLRVSAKGKPLAKAYVKTYARMSDGSVAFYKDGYTDLRGRFDYSTLSTSELANVTQFSILVLHEEFGAVVQEANPPKR